MELIKPIHAKVIWTLVGGATSMNFFLDIDSNEVFAWYLIEIDPLHDTWVCFIAIFELTMLPIKALSLLLLYAIYHLIFRILWICILLWAISMFNSIIGCLNVCFICSNKMHVVCHICKLTLMSYDSACGAI